MPKAKLTKSVVDRLPYTESGQVTFHDSELPGFYLIVGKATKTYVAQKDMQGRSVRLTIGRHGLFTPDEARRIARDKLYMMSMGVNPHAKEKAARAKAVSLETALESYLTTRKNLKPRTIHDYRYNIEKYLPDWMNRQMTLLTKDMIGARHVKIAENHGSTSANKTMRILRALFNHCYATYDVCPANPVEYLSHTKGWYREKRRRTYIKAHDLAAWWKAVHALENDTYRDFFLLLLFTGLRRGEAAQIRWVDIDFKDRTLLIPDTKNGDPLTLPLSDFLFKMLHGRNQRYGGEEFVFPGTGRHGFLAEPKKGVHAVIDASGVSFSCHDLRRTFITMAESLDISSYALKRLINHRVTDITGSYIIVDANRLRGPVERIASEILTYAEENSS